MTNSNEKLDITGFLRELENYMNIKLIGIDPEAEEIIYGMKFFDKFTQS
jgi:hypothetical protein